MKPRSLRHRLEKIAKLLVTVHKHTPEVDCLINQDKGQHGHVVLDFAGSGMSRSKMNALGKDLQTKGYTFTEKNSPWLGQITYTGREEDKPTVVFTLPIVKDRLAINEETHEKSYTFGS
ncbi:hypothetical protein SH580_01220 [Coraliomargarita algicola]|uniref:Uncharacterized protein n=2 Tax=Coraliomargaritaceae TaxID=3056371 RepID=A0ABU1AQR0_9BACT|nr:MULTISPECIES: hypothetical protein [unclassified Coraliomargarita]MDQ8206504.1 hypothetical protein [Coraliomargarita sp. SDUM461003]WPJ96321.1 hypothetical protein SH580_01220 [Coraliomargarita sp. J2-16]